MTESLLPPGRTERVAAQSALVLAPHYDDEVLGCGGLLAQLAAGGSVVRVLFLSDGGGGRQEVGDRDGYRRRRRDEAACACRTLGLAGCDHLSLPDGELALRLEEAERGIRRALLTQRPDLLLAPSPLEVTADHRAVFAALHGVLAPLRDGELGELRVLLYEVNRPGHPDLLVDVTAEEATLAAAMSCYASQQERHDYLAAALGLRRYRTLTLTPGVRLAEGYRRLALADFTTRSQAQLVRHLGGLPELLEVREGPRLSVVMRTKDRPALLAQALASLAATPYRRAEVVLVNDGGAPPEVASGFPLPVVRVDLEGNRGRAAAAEAGVAAATGEFVTFLDDDDLAAPEHLPTLAGMAAAPGVRVAYTDAAVAVYELGEDGWRCAERRLPYSRDFDPDLLLLDNYVPFNTLAIERGLFAEVGPFDPELPFFEDWDFLIRLAERAPFHHHRRVTCEYRHFRGGAHHVFGERPRERPDFLAVKARVLAKHATRLTPERLARAVDTLRFEAVTAREDADRLERELGPTREELWARSGEAEALRKGYDLLAGERSDLEGRYWALNGELETLRALHERVAAEAQRLYADEAKLRAVVEDQTAHLGRTYAEIERLNAELARLAGRLREIEGTAVWRLGRWWARRFS
ncbi:MAG TPA: PIG-L family deacetylase [Thermoanaerobaculia bacterium]|nr:PIG-L family deacetylase [Thermoanaerobaculia bacterium]